MEVGRKIKIAYLCTGNPTDKTIWSGTMYKMYEALISQDFEIIWVPTPKYSPREEKIFSLVQKFYQLIFRRNFNRHHSILKAYIASTKLRKKIAHLDYDLLFAPTYATEIAFLNIEKPIIYLNDGTFNKLINYNPAFMGLGWLSKNITRFIERKALEKAEHLVFSSNWAADDSRNTYGTPTHKVSVIKFGANLIAPSNSIERKDYSGNIQFLFLAVGWGRKGGEIALKTIEILQKKGYDVTFKILGCTPNINEKFVEIIPFLNKNIPEELAEIGRHLLEAHLLFVPTRTDCTPISFCEAASYGLPVISTDTGGVSAVVETGKTGILLPLEATAEDYADELEVLLGNPDLMKNLSINARKKYEEELNWEVWGREMANTIKKIHK